MPHTKIIKFSAKDAEEISDGHFRCAMNDRCMAQVKAVSLKTAIFNNNVYNVKTGVNDTLYFRIDADEVQTVSIPAGYYSAIQAAAALEALIQVILDGAVPGATIEIVFNPITAKLESTVVGADFAYDNEAIALDSIGTTLGLAVGTGVSTPDATLFTFPNFPRLQGLSHVTISVKSGTPKTYLNVNSSESRFTNSIGMVGVDVPFGGTVNYNQPDFNLSLCDFSNLQDMTVLDIAIQDENGVGLANQQPYFAVEFLVWGT